jgi:hypothetical protein
MPNRARGALAALLTLLLASTATSQSESELDWDQTESQAHILSFALETSGGEVSLHERIAAQKTYAGLLAPRVDQLVGERGSVEAAARGVTIILEGCTEDEIAAVRALVQVPVDGQFAVAVTTDDERVDRVALHGALVALLADWPADEPVDVSRLERNLGEHHYAWCLMPPNSREAPNPDTWTRNPEAYELMEFTSSEAGFDVRDFAAVNVVLDQLDGLALEVHIKPERMAAFGAYTEGLVGRATGIVMGGRLVHRPATIQSRLADRFILSSGVLGGFAEKRVMQNWVRLSLGSGELTLVHEHDGPATFLDFGR